MEDIERFEIEQPGPQFRLRVNRTSSLFLTTTWQRIDFNGTSARNANSFPVRTMGGKPKVHWDPTNKTMRFMTVVDQTYNLQLSTRITSSSLLALAGLAITKVHLRLVVPSPTPMYMPLSDATDPFVDMCAVNLTGASQNTFGLPIFADAAVREYGVGIEFRLSAPLADVYLTAADLHVHT